MVGQPRIDIPSERVASFCRKWLITELSLFGSVLRDDFGPASDVDVVVSFDAGATWDLWDLMDMRDELAQMFGRDVDLIEREGLRNPFRRHEILTTRRVVYAA